MYKTCQCIKKFFSSYFLLESNFTYTAFQSEVIFIEVMRAIDILSYLW